VAGELIEVGAGNGANFEHYPAAVTRLVATEPEPYLREQVRGAASRARVEVEVSDAVAEELPFEDGRFDAGVACLVLCTVRDQERALGELHRVIRPGGELRFYEHVHAERQPGRALLELADRTFWPLVAGGCHPTRETGRAIEAAGFRIESCRRFAFAASRIEPPIPHILGIARRL
jgi:ubiquinone/menaquinone biosynthesis C-methylase UbiE